MINIEESPLRALKQNIITAPFRLVKEDDGIGDERRQIIPSRAIGLVDGLEGKRFGPECLENFVVLFELGLKLPRESLRINQIQHAQTGSRRFIAVSGANPSFRRADLIFAFEDLALRIELAMI